jgi:arylsulfatase A-like enzyme
MSRPSPAWSPSQDSVANNSAGRRPNVVMIVTDNQSADSLGCYGNTEHETPNIDRLAREGLRFDAAFCTNGTCSPTRASILTGLMPSQHGVHLAIPDDPPLGVPHPDGYDVTREFRTMHGTLQAAGYQTAMVGKWHLGDPRTPPSGWDHWVAHTRGHTTDFWDNDVIKEGAVRRIRDRHIVDWFADEAISFLAAREATTPFFLQLNFDAPYVLPPTVVGANPRNPFYERFAGRTFAPFPAIDPAIVRSLSLPFDEDLDPAEEYTLASAVNNAWWALRSHNDPETRANVAAENALVDAAVGRVVAQVDSLGLTEDTLILVTTDQGNPYGQHGLWGHPVWTDPPFMHDVTFRVPLLARRPGVVPENRATDTMISHYDLLPTVLAHVGLGDVAASGSPGRSFAAVLEPRSAGAPGPDLGLDPLGRSEAVYFEVETARSVRTHTHRYTRHLSGCGEPELFDLVADPDQHQDVAGDPAHAAAEQDLSERVDLFWAEFSDPRYDLWQGGTGQAMVSRYVTFAGRNGPGWNVTTEVGAPFSY